MVNPGIRNMIILITIHLGIIALHWITANAYSIYCAKSGFWGIVASVFVNQAPHCVALRWGINFGADHIRLMWTSLGTWSIMQVMGILGKKID